MKIINKNIYFQLIFLLLMLVIFIFPPYNKIIYANDNTTTQQEIEEELNGEIDKELNELDFSSIENLLDSLYDEQMDLFGNNSFLDVVKKLIKGEFNTNNIWISMLEIFTNTFIKLLPFISIIIAISILGNILQIIRNKNNDISNIIEFVSYALVLSIVLTILIKIIDITTGTILQLKTQMDAIFPILLTLMVTLGGNVAITVYQPAMAFLSNIIMNFFCYILLPIFIFSVVFSIIANLSDNIKLNKFISFFNSSYKWLLGLVFTVFTAFLSIHGITAGTIDGISIRTAKYAIKSYIPVLGSYISDGMGLILASSNLIKNAVGASGLLLLVATILSPILHLIFFMLALKLIAGIVEPIGNKRVANFISSLSQNIKMLIILLVGIGFIYFITVGLVMCSVNIF